MDDRDMVRETGLIAYFLFGISIVAGPVIFAGIIYVYMKRADVRGTYADSHFEWLIRTFWILLIASLIGYVLILVFVGFILLGLLWLWFVFRVVKGFVAFNDGQPMRDPQALF
jgi:uncharacterized membrane protein